MGLAALWKGTSVRVFALYAYIDDTEAQHYAPRHFGVGGFLFSPENAEKFSEAWLPRIKGLSKPYRTAACSGGYPPFQDWLKEERENFIRDLARLTADTRDAGFVAFVHTDDYESELQRNAQMVKRAGSIYTVCLMHCMDAVVGYMKERHPDETVVYWIESGTKNEAEAADFMRRIAASERNRDRFRLGGYGFYPKVTAPPLCAADLLCWEWQRNYVESFSETGEGTWREPFRLLFKDKQSKPIIPVKLGPTTIGIRGMIHSFYGLDKD